MILSNPHDGSLIIIILISQMSKLRLKGYNDNYKQRSLMRGCADLVLNPFLHLKDEGPQEWVAWPSQSGVKGQFYESAILR